MNGLDLGLIDKLALSIIRPYRTLYKDRDLGDRLFRAGGTTFQRTDFTLLNDRSQKLCISHFRPTTQQFTKVAVYLHGNSGCRADARCLLDLLAEQGYGLLAFDFSGSGNSEGSYVSMGLQECEDLRTVFKHACETLGYKQVLLWGRSMGAVTALRFAQLYPSPALAGLVADSPFSSFRQLATELGERRVYFPNVLLGLFVGYLLEQIRQRFGIALEQCDVGPMMGQVECPVVFIASKDDDLIPVSHTDRLFSLAPKQKKIVYVQGKHNDRRDTAALSQALAFFDRGQPIRRLTQSIRGIDSLQRKTREEEPKSRFFQSTRAQGSVPQLSGRHSSYQEGTTRKTRADIAQDIALRREAYVLL